MIMLRGMPRSREWAQSLSLDTQTLVFEEEANCGGMTRRFRWFGLAMMFNSCSP